MKECVMNRKLTIVTVTYNAEKDLEKTLESIFTQTYFSEVEFIVIDGSSTDETINIINTHKDKIDVFISESDNGVYDAMNKSIDLATGEWINFMNAGDAFHDKWVIEKFIKRIDASLDLIYGDVNILGEGIDKVIKADLQNKIFKETPFCHQSLFVKTNLMKNKKFNTTYKVLADYDFILNSYFENKKFGYLDFTVSKYQLGGMSQNNINKMYIEGVHILMKMQKNSSKIILEDSSFYKGLKSTLGDEHSLQIKDEVYKLSNISFKNNPLKKYYQYKKLVNTYYGISESENVDEFNVLHLSTFDNVGGAARATLRLHEALKKNSYLSGILSLFKSTNDKNVYTIFNTRFKRYILKFFQKLSHTLYGFKELEADKPYSINKFGLLLHSNKLVQNCKILHLHWINYHYISLRELEKIVSLKKPMVWTMHDMWAFTGGCHNPIDCRKYQNECGTCPILESSRSNDISNAILKRKIDIFKNANITIIAPSYWMKKQVKNSTIFKDKRVEVIPNAINYDFFKKTLFENIKLYFPFIEKRTNYICFGAHSKASYKGLDFLIDALILYAKENDTKDLELVIFGDTNQEVLEKLPKSFVHHNVGKIVDDNKLRALYGFVDIFVSPSLQESFGQVLTESMACETACIAFNNSGSLDIIDHKVNGYLADYKDSNSIKNGLVYLLNDKIHLEKMQKNAREKIINSFDYDIVAKQHIDLYESIVETRFE